MKRYFKRVSIPFLLAICAGAQAQKPGTIEKQTEPFAAIRSTDTQVRSFLTAASTYSAAKISLGTVKPEITGSESSAEAQRQLEAELTRFTDAVNGIEQFKKELKNLDVQISLINNGINSLKIVSPTSNFLGASFAEILMQNALEILGNDVGNANQRSRFQKILGLVVSNPIVSSFFNANPITSMAREAVSQAVTISDGKIQKSTIDRFNKSIAPYLDFYGSIDRAADDLQQSLVSISIAINKKQSKMSRLERGIEDVLGSYDGKTPREKLRNVLKMDKQADMTAIQIKEVLSSPDVALLNRLIERQLFVVDDFVDDPVALQTSYNQYIERMKTILSNAKDTEALSFDPGKIQEAISQYRPI